MLFGVLRHGPSRNSDAPLLATLEAASFGLCCIGIVTGGRSVRNRYATLGSDKSVASRNSTYMQERRDLQITAAVACAAVASLVASRCGLNPLYAGLIVLGSLAAALPFINRMTGWSPKS